MSTPTEQAKANRDWWDSATKAEKVALLKIDLMKCRCRCFEFYAANPKADIRPCNSCGPIRGSLKVVLAEWKAK